MKSLLGHTRKPDISFHANGRIDITAHVAHILGISNGDVIDVAIEGREYYLYVRQRSSECRGRHEAQCWSTKPRSHNFRAHSHRLCHAILQVSGVDIVARLPIGETRQINDKKMVTLIIYNNLEQ